MNTLAFFKRGTAARDIRLEAAQGAIAAPANETLAILALLANDEDEEVRTTAANTLKRLPDDAVRAYLDTSDVPDDVRQHLLQQIADAEDLDPELTTEGAVERDGLFQKLARMTFPERLKAASMGSREVRAILIRDPSKSIAMAVLTSAKVTEQEVESFARMGSVAEDILRAIGKNRTWMKNYGVVVALLKNAKTPVGLSLNLMHRLNDRDLASLSTDRNIPEPLRVAARKKVVNAISR
jgi:hypothetical protein